MRKLYASSQAAAMMAAMNYVPTMGGLQYPDDDDPEVVAQRERQHAENVKRMDASQALQEHRAAIMGKMRSAVGQEVALRTNGFGVPSQFLKMIGMKSDSFQLQYLVLLHNFGYRWDVRETLNGWSIAFLPKAKEGLARNWKIAREETLQELASLLSVSTPGKKELLWDILARSGYELRSDVLHDGIIAFELWREETNPLEGWIHAEAPFMEIDLSQVPTE